MKRYTTDELQQEFEDWHAKHVKQIAEENLFIDLSMLNSVERFIEWLKDKE